MWEGWKNGLPLRGLSTKAEKLTHGRWLTDIMKWNLGKGIAKAAREPEEVFPQLAGYPGSSTEHGEAALSCARSKLSAGTLQKREWVILQP